MTADGALPGGVTGAAWMATVWVDPGVKESESTYGTVVLGVPNGSVTFETVSMLLVAVPSVPPDAVDAETGKQSDAVLLSEIPGSFQPDGMESVPPVRQSSVPSVVSAMYPESEVLPTAPFRIESWMFVNGMTLSGLHGDVTPAAVPESVDAPPKLVGVNASDVPELPTADQSVWNVLLQLPPAVNVTGTVFVTGWL